MNKKIEKLNDPLTRTWDMPTRFLHWVSAICVSGLMALGLVTVNQVKASGLKFELYQWHKSFGLIFGIVLIARLVWKFLSPRPNFTGADIAQKAAIINQNLMLLILVVLIASGYVATCFSIIPIPIRVFGWAVPSLLQPDLLMEQKAISAHHALAFFLLALVLVHSGAALFHHFILKDKTLMRMLKKQAD